MTASTWLTNLTRIGFATRGLLYVVIAYLIARTGRAADTSGAIDYLGHGGGRGLLAVMAIGLFAYGLWRIADAAFDVEHHGADRKGVAQRVGAAISGIVHLFLGWQAVRLIRGVAMSGGDGANGGANGGAEQGAQTVMTLPGGWLLVIAGGGVLFAVGIAQLVKAYRGGFLRYLEPRIARRPWAQWSGRAGYAARGIVFLISAYFLCRAGVEGQASAAGGMEQVLSWLDNPWDVVVAIGLCGFGIFSLIEARFRVLHDVPVDDIVRRATSG